MRLMDLLRSVLAVAFFIGAIIVAMRGRKKQLVFLKTDCGHCGQPIEFPDYSEKESISCPACQSPVVLLRKPGAPVVVEHQLPTRWLWFWVYVRLPLSVLVTLIEFAGMASPSGSVVLVTLAVVGVYCFTVWGLHERTRWGWELNWLVLILDGISMMFREGIRDGAIMFGHFMVAAVWVSCNYVYFRKRRHLFSAINDF